MSIVVALVVGAVIFIYWRVALTLLVIALLALLLLGLTVALDDLQVLQTMSMVEAPTPGDQPNP